MLKEFFLKSQMIPKYGPDKYKDVITFTGMGKASGRVAPGMQSILGGWGEILGGGPKHLSWVPLKAQHQIWEAIGFSSS